VGRKSGIQRACSAAFLLLAVAACHRDDGRDASRGKSNSMAAPDQRAAALARARVWLKPATPVPSFDFRANPPGPDSFDPAADVDCTFSDKPISGTTPKFFCTLASGEAVKVKYGGANGEIPAEIAATRLLTALGFPADRMYPLHTVRCHGCPVLPQQALQCLEKGGPAAVCMEGATASTVRTFEHPVIERPFEGHKIQAEPDQGWSWYELDKIDPRVGGSPRAHVDALRLVAVVLAHWDNKGANQRLICPDGKERADGTCSAPLAMIQDLGATFGPNKMDLLNWRRTPVWSDAPACRVSMTTLPFGGATFKETTISEEGRQFALQLFRQLSREQLDALFEGAGVTTFEQVVAEARNPSAWTDAFLAKVDQIASAGPCI
jgi:hypothetical protein